MFLIPKGDLHLPTNMKVEPWQDLKGALTIGVSTYTGKDRCSAHNRTIDIRPSEMRSKDVVKRIDMLQTSPKKDLITKNIKMKQTNKKTHTPLISLELNQFNGVVIICRTLVCLYEC